MGVKYKSDSMRERRQVTVMLTDLQYAKLKQLAAADHNRPLSNFLRKYLRDTILKEVSGNA